MQCQIHIFRSHFHFPRHCRMVDIRRCVSILYTVTGRWLMPTTRDESTIFWEQTWIQIQINLEIRIKIPDHCWLRLDTLRSLSSLVDNCTYWWRFALSEHRLVDRGLLSFGHSVYVCWIAGRSVVRIVYAVDRHFKHCNVECSSRIAMEIVAQLDSVLCRRPGVTNDRHALQKIDKPIGRNNVVSRSTWMSLPTLCRQF